MPNLIERIERRLNPKSQNVWLGLLLTSIVLLAVRNRFIQDDAFISFRYAENLVRHHNLSWNATDVLRLEGYTNFSWTMLIAALLELGVDPVRASMVLGVGAGVGTLLVVHSITKLLTGDFRYGLLAIVLLGTNYTFSAYMTGGLETQLQTFMLALAAFFFVRLMQSDARSRRDFFLAGLFSALAILTRLDSPIVIGVLALGSLSARYRADRRVGSVISGALWFTLPVVLVVLPWLLWKQAYYGNVLPNSFYLKGREFNLEVLISGLAFLISFFVSYQLFVPCLLLLLVRGEVRQNRIVLTLLAVLAAWCVYILKVGGDFMEYRFMVPVLPLLMVCIAWALKTQQNSLLRWGAVLLVLEGSIAHRMLFKTFHRIDTVENLDNFVNRREFDWKGIGLKLRELLPGPANPVVIAVTAAGAIPYYSQLKTIDMLGVNDRWIAMHGVVASSFRPGHSKRGTLQYYLDTRVNLLLGHPQVHVTGWSKNRTKLSMSEFGDFEIPDLDRAAVPAEARIVEIPVDTEHAVFALYLKPIAEVETLIRDGIARPFEID